jgi:hypothetical protein
MVQEVNEKVVAHAMSWRRRTIDAIGRFSENKTHMAIKTQV